MYPPVSKTQSGRWPTGDGYGVFDQYDIGWKNQVGARETQFGDRERLQRSIAIARACGLDIYLDVVMHQQSGSNGGDGVYRYVGADGTPGTGRFPKHPGCFRGNPPRRPQDPVASPFWDFAFGDEFVYKDSSPPRYTIDGMVAFGDWLTRSLDVQGYRVDDVKGTWVGFVKEWMSRAPWRRGFVCLNILRAIPTRWPGGPRTRWVAGRQSTTSRFTGRCRISATMEATCVGWTARATSRARHSAR